MDAPTGQHQNSNAQAAPLPQAQTATPAVDDDLAQRLNNLRK